MTSLQKTFTEEKLSQKEKLCLFAYFGKGEFRKKKLSYKFPVTGFDASEGTSQMFTI